MEHFAETMKKTVPSLLMVSVGAVIAAFAVAVFLVPADILDGGIVGVSIIISALSGLPLSVLTFVLNVPFLLLGLKSLGKRFLATGIWSMALFSLMLHFFESMETGLELDPILHCVFGGVLLGFGVGLVLRGGGCLDGTEIVALLLSKKTRLSVGQIVFGFNILIYGTAGFVFQWNSALFSLMAYFLSFKVIDMVEQGLEQAKSVMIITDDGQAMADAIYQRMGRTCTMMEGAGRISGAKSVLYCVVTRVELSTMRRIIGEADGSAFVTISDISEIVGNHIKRHPPVPPKKEALSGAENAEFPELKKEEGPEAK